ncbi:SCO6880 family protein [uncultured Cellulomonas sp.]|uniref:SCO6880 family protein n=1 Tax=uncultured Cellulomonas sp. TaxID=189682 RepID=UPI0028E37554|nr:SCO6880 family protein [uncultured Cellulomonas sp.]
MTSTETGPVASTVRFGRLEQRGVLLGLSMAQLAVVGVAFTVAVAALFSGGAAGFAVMAPVWLTLLVVGTVSVTGRPVVGWVPLLAQWHVRKLSRATTAVTPAGTKRAPDALVLPGLAGRLDLVRCDALGASLILDRHAGVICGVLRVTGAGFVLDDAAAQELKVAGWGRVLAGLCQQPAIVRVQLLARTVPGGLAPARRWWRDHCASPTTELSIALAGLLDGGFVQPHARDTLLAVALRAPRRHRAVTAGDIAVVTKHLEAVASSLVGASLTSAGWLGRDDLAAVVRSGYDPQTAARSEDAAVSLAGPMGVHELWSMLRADGAVHATYWVAEWPRSEVHPAFLQSLLLGEATLRTVTVIAEPLATARALREIRRSKAEHIADAAQRARIGQVEAESTRAEVDDLERREVELVAGHGDLRFTGLVTVSATSEAELEERCVALETAAAQAMCEVRRLFGQQGQAHLAAALPLARGVL